MSYYRCIVDVVRGVTEIDDQVFVAFKDSRELFAYQADTFQQFRVLSVHGLNDPRDMVVCRDDRQLYVAETDCIWRVSSSTEQQQHQYVKWLTTESTFHIGTLSLTSRHLLVTSQSLSLRQYGTTDGQLLRDVQLPQFVKVMWHAVETTRGTFVVGHQGTSHDKQQFAVSSLFIWYLSVL